MSTQTRLSRLEAKLLPKQHTAGLSHAHRKHLTDRAVNGDAEALVELNKHRLKKILGSADQRAAARSAGLRADT